MTYPLHVTNSKEYIESLIAKSEMLIKAGEDKVHLHTVNTTNQVKLRPDSIHPDLLSYSQIFDELEQDTADFTFEQAKELARKGIKMTHTYFTPDEYITMQGNQVIFEDGVRIFVNEWSKGKDYLLTGWSIYQED